MIHWLRMATHKWNRMSDVRECDDENAVCCCYCYFWKYFQIWLNSFIRLLVPSCICGRMWTLLSLSSIYIYINIYIDKFPTVSFPLEIYFYCHAIFFFKKIFFGRIEKQINCNYIFDKFSFIILSLKIILRYLYFLGIKWLIYSYN